MLLAMPASLHSPRKANRAMEALGVPGVALQGLFLSPGESHLTLSCHRKRTALRVWPGHRFGHVNGTAASGARLEWPCHTDGRGTRKEREITNLSLTGMHSCCASVAGCAG